jgi:hypothetical protein
LLLPADRTKLNGALEDAEFVALPAGPLMKFKILPTRLGGRPRPVVRK